MLKLGLSAALFVAATSAFAQAQPAAPAGPGAAIEQAGMAFGQCIGAGIQGLAATVTPEAGATTVLAGCATQRQALEQAAEAMIATMPEAQQAPAREQMRTQLASAETRIADGIRRSRVAAAPAPAQ